MNATKFFSGVLNNPHKNDHSYFFQDWSFNKNFVNTLMILLWIKYIFNPAFCNNSDFYLWSEWGENFENITMVKKFKGFQGWWGAFKLLKIKTKQVFIYKTLCYIAVILISMNAPWYWEACYCITSAKHLFLGTMPISLYSTFMCSYVNMCKNCNYVQLWYCNSINMVEDFDHNQQIKQINGREPWKVDGVEPHKGFCMNDS